MLDPLIQTELPESVLLAGVLPCGIAGGFDLVDADGLAERRVCFFPHLGVCPVLIHVRSENDRVEGRVNLSAGDDVKSFLMHLVADAFGVVSGSRDKEIQRLHSSIAGALDHNIVELSVRLRVQLIEYNAVGIEAVLVRNVCRQNLIFALGRQILNGLLGFGDFHPFFQSRTEANHVHGNIKDDFCLIAVGGTAVDFGSLFTVTTKEKQSDSRCEFAFAVLFRHFDKGGVELSVSVCLYGAEHITDDLFLPIDKLEVLSRPCAFCVAEALDKADRKVSLVFIVMGAFRHKAGWLVLFQLSDSGHLLENGIKIAATVIGATSVEVSFIFWYETSA